MHLRAPQVEQSSNQAKERHNQVPEDYETESRIFKASIKRHRLWYSAKFAMVDCMSAAMELSRRDDRVQPTLNIDQVRRRNIILRHDWLVVWRNIA